MLEAGLMVVYESLIFSFSLSVSISHQTEQECFIVLITTGSHTVTLKEKKPWDKANVEDKKNPKRERNWVLNDINELLNHTILRNASDFCSYEEINTHYKLI